LLYVTEVVGDDSYIRPHYELEVIEKREDKRADPLVKIERDFKKEREEAKRKPKKSKQTKTNEKKIVNPVAADHVVVAEADAGVDAKTTSQKAKMRTKTIHQTLKPKRVQSKTKSLRRKASLSAAVGRNLLKIKSQKTRKRKVRPLLGAVGGVLPAKPKTSKLKTWLKSLKRR